MYKIIWLVILCFCLSYTPLAFAVAGGGGGGGTGGGGASVPSLHILGQLLFVLFIALWSRKSK